MFLDFLIEKKTTGGTSPLMKAGFKN